MAVCDKYPPWFKDSNNHSENQEDIGGTNKMVTYKPHETWEGASNISIRYVLQPTDSVNSPLL